MGAGYNECIDCVMPVGGLVFFHQSSARMLFSSHSRRRLRFHPPPGYRLDMHGGVDADVGPEPLQEANSLTRGEPGIVQLPGGEIYAVSLGQGSACT